jgi:aspartyl-tRNA(Asn)/glutamyl-tRNA(Gln) amidotransferase subunit C
MIDRAQVLHVAKLARLALSEEEVERMSRELSAVLDHIERISALELDGVAPTSHVVDVVNALRPDEPRPSLPREVALAPAPERIDDGFGVPSPGAAAHEQPEADRLDQSAGLDAPRR